MRNVAPVMQRELSSYFWSPIAYVVLTIFLIVSGVLFILFSFVPGGESSLRTLLGQQMPMILVFVVPMLTMRLLSEEYRSGTIETLMTAPISETDVVLGKFLGGLFFYCVLLAATVVYAVIMSSFGRLDWGLLFCTYVGLILLGGLFVSIGLFFSACTPNQIVAVLSSFVVIGMFTFLAHRIATETSGILRLVLHHLSIFDHYQDFARGLLDLNHVIFFVTTTGLFLFLSVKVLESRRWR